MKSLKIGVVINATQKPSRDFLSGFEQGAQKQVVEHPEIDLRFFLGSAATTLDNLTEFASVGFDVVVFNGMGRKLPMQLLQSLEKRPAAVFAEYEPFGDADWETLGEGAVVLFDNRAVGENVADFFVSHGLRNFAFINRNGGTEDVTGRLRCEAFKARAKASCGETMTFNEYSVGKFAPNEDYWEVDQAEAAKWFKELPCPCGIFVNGDHLAFSLALGCARLGIPVPERFEVVGLDNNEGCCENSIPTITSVKIDIGKFAAKAVEVAISLATNRRLRKSRLTETVSDFAIVERGSTAVGRGYGRVAARAKEYIRLNACSGISVLDVAKALNVSRRTLEVRVREATDKSVHTLISEVKLAQICRLLKETDYPISDVVTRSGYSLTTNAFVFFKRMYGMTMREYRRQFRPPRKLTKEAAKK